MKAVHAPIYASRLAALVDAILPHLKPGDRVLDVGCGVGTLGRAILDHPGCPAGVEVAGLERSTRGGEPIPVRQYDGGRMPDGDGAHDVVIVADVLHHEEDPDELLRECARVSRRLVIIKDHQVRGPWSKLRVSAMDWAANAPHGVKCLFAYRSPEEWSRVPGELGMHAAQVYDGMKQIGRASCREPAPLGAGLRRAAPAHERPAAQRSVADGWGDLMSDSVIDDAPTPTPANDARDRPLWRHLLKLARPKQWAKSGFVLIGPLYGLRDAPEGTSFIAFVLPAFLAAAVFALASSGCYVINDLADRDADKLHPRKRNRPIASGAVSPGLAKVFAAVLLACSGLFLLLLEGRAQLLTLIAVALYIANVFAYSVYFKHKVIADVISLSMGFVLRVLGGCAAVAIVPTTWLLNVTFFLSMFLAFGKRLGERRTLGTSIDPVTGDDLGAAGHRKVQERYTDTLLQMAVVVTAVGTLMTYAFYVNDRAIDYTEGFNLLWLTLLPATYGMLRCIVLLETGKFDDPTELAYKDRGFIVAGLAFAAMTAALFVYFTP
jgi:decaprenyl-phosphate phosphoribosyltransferase